MKNGTAEWQFRCGGVALGWRLRKELLENARFTFAPLLLFLSKRACEFRKLTCGETARDKRFTLKDETNGCSSL